MSTLAIALRLSLEAWRRRMLVRVYFTMQRHMGDFPQEDCQV